jgi:hypothetical protein
MTLTRTPTLCRYTLAAGLAASLFIAGCDRDTGTARAIEDARLELLVMSSGDTLAAPQARTDLYQKVLTQLRPVSGKGTSSQKAATALLMSQAQAGLAQGPAGAVGDLEAAALHQASAVRSMLSQWLVLNASADASASYDPGPELSGLQEQTRQRQQRIGQAEAAKAEVEQRVADLRQQASAKHEQARSLHQEAGRLRQQVANQTAVEGEATLIRAREIARRADGLEVEAADLEARAEQLEPQVVEAEMRTAGLRDQLERLAAAVQEVQGRANVARDEAATARAQAAEVARDLHAAVVALRGLREGELAETYDEAIRGHQAAASSAREAMTENRTAAQLAVGSAHQVIGDLEWGRSHGLAFHHEMLIALVEAQPALPNASEYRRMAEAAKTARQAALDAATESYIAAHSAYEAAGAGERMARVSAALDAIVKVTSGGSRDLGMIALPGHDPYAPQGGEWDGGMFTPGSTPQETLAQLAAASETPDPSMIELFYAEDGQQRATLEAFFSLVPSLKRFSDALEMQFGPEAQEMLGAMAGQSGMMTMESFDPDAVVVTIDGDEATADLPGGERLHLREVGGMWLVDMSDQLDQMAMMAPMVGPMRVVIDEVADEVEAGQYSDVQAAMAALQQRMMSAMMGGG